MLDAETQRTRAIGLLHNGLYHMKDALCSVPAHLVNSSSKSKASDFALWHNKLGHAPLAKIKCIPSLKSQIVPTDKVCVTYPMSKFSKLPFDLIMSHVVEKFELIHIDMWGPYKVATRGKYKYFLTIVDDNTRVTWIYLLQFKSDYLSTMKSFYNYVEVHFKEKIRNIRSDNALEFADEKCRQFYAEKGIRHQTSCVNRPQQNARVERRHRYVLEVARCLRFQAGLSLVFWDECVMTAVYLINRLPTPVLGNKTPYKTLFAKPVDYDCMRTFGCLAFAANPMSNGDKFGPKGVPCVFVGYPFAQKGYTLLNLTTMQTFVSRDVVFHEEVFPLNESSSKSYIHRTHVVMPHSESVPFAHDDLIELEVDAPENSAGTRDSTPQPVLRHSSRVTRKPAWLDGYVSHVQSSSNVVQVVDLPLADEFHCFVAAVSSTADPVSFKQVVQCPHWVDAMNNELTALEENKAWIFTTLPPGKKPIAVNGSSK